MRARYVADLEQIARASAPSATEIEIDGVVPVGDTNVRVRATAPLAEWQDAARAVGQVLADVRLRALGGHSVQEIETWDDIDEDHAQRIREALVHDRSVVHAGNDAQLLSGATLALLDDPGLYETVTARLEEALDESFLMDERWGVFRPDPVYLAAPAAGAAAAVNHTKP